MNVQAWVDFVAGAVRPLGLPSGYKIDGLSLATWNTNPQNFLYVNIGYGAWSIFGLKNPRYCFVTFSRTTRGQRELFQAEDAPELEKKLIFTITVRKRYAQAVLNWKQGDQECVKALSPQFRSFLEGLLRAGRKRRRNSPSMLRVSDMNARRFVLFAVREMTAKRHKGL